MIETSLAPGLLLAMPQLHDPHFTRAVVLMVEHSEHGSFGLVVNQPGELVVRDLLESLEIEWCGRADDMVWRGGPVMPGLGWILHDPVDYLMPAPAPQTGTEASESVLTVVSGSLSSRGADTPADQEADQEADQAHGQAPGPGTDPDADEDVGTILLGPNLALSGGSVARLRTVAAQPPPHVRLLLGYAGWGPGQLAQEMARGSWLHADVSLDILFHTPPEQMWERALRSLGIGPENIVQGMGIH